MMKTGAIRAAGAVREMLGRTARTARTARATVAEGQYDKGASDVIETNERSNMEVQLVCKAGYLKRGEVSVALKNK